MQHRDGVQIHIQSSIRVSKKSWCQTRNQIHKLHKLIKLYEITHFAVNVVMAIINSKMMTYYNTCLFGEEQLITYLRPYQHNQVYKYGPLLHHVTSQHISANDNILTY